MTFDVSSEILGMPVLLVAPSMEALIHLKFGVSPLVLLELTLVYKALVTNIAFVQLVSMVVHLQSQ